MFRSALRWALPLTLCVSLCSTAAAYTIVMRDGRRIEIPDRFVVTATALTYEAGPGIQVTVLLSNIDIEATERANGEPAGSLLHRARSSGSSTSKVAQRAAKTLTNEEIDRARRARGQAPIERSKAQLSDVERENEAEARRLLAEAERRDQERAQQEAYWRERARALREQIAAIDGELSYWTELLNGLPTLPSGIIGSVTTVVGVPLIPLFPVIGGVATPPRPSMPRFATGPAIAPAPPSPPRAIIPQAPSLTPISPVLGAPLIRFPAHRIIVPTFISVVAPFNQSFYYDRASIIARIQQLEAMRAALTAQWRVLEDEARRAGVPPGALR
jgi:hypothetical protein